jgi:hypothetical protein
VIEDLDVQIRKALAAVVTATVDPEAVVFDYWVLGYEAQQWLGLVRKAGGLAHGYIITRRLAGQISDGAATDEVWNYTLIGIHSYFHSSDVTGERSEDIFSKEIDQLILAFKPDKIFQLESGDEIRYGDNQVVIDLFPFGIELAHYATFDLEVKFSIC